MWRANSCLAPHALAQPLDERARRHVEGCVECRRALARVQAAQSLMQLAHDSVPPDPTAAELVRTEASLRWTRATPLVRTRRPFVAARAATGALALALAVHERATTPQRATLPARPQLAHATPAAPLPSGPIQALVTLVGGDVRLAHAGSHTRPLDMDAQLAAGDKLHTGANGKMAAQWSEGSGFLLFGDAELALARLEARTQRLELARGKVSVRVGPHDQASSPLADRTRPSESLQVITPNHVVSVHGTWFSVASAAHVTTVEVLEGVVEVTERDGSASTLLTAPARAVFGHGGHIATATMGAHEAKRAREASEMNLGPWYGLEAARKASAALRVTSDPTAQLAVDGVEVGATPLAVRRPIGRHYIELTRADFAPQRQWLAVGPESEGLRLSLVKEPPQPEESVPVEIESMVRRRSQQIRNCYERRLKRDPSLAGTVSLRLRVGSAGQVSKVSIEESTLPDPLVGECLRREAAGWSFSVGRNATVVYPFVFRAQ